MHKHKHHPSHFQGKEALAHVIEAHQKGVAASNETHGTELSGHWSALTDAAKETSILFLFFFLILGIFPIDIYAVRWALMIFSSAWLVWKMGRSALLAWSRLERMHRILEEERWEIQHHRPQEREELGALYRAKGFSGKQLEEVLDVLMADDNRLLQVMLQEELGLPLESLEHPLKQALGAGFGVVIATGTSLLSFLFFPFWAVVGCTALVIGCCAGITARLERNHVMPAIVWNVAVAALAIGVVYFALQWILPA